MKKVVIATLTFCLLLSGYGSALKVSAHQEPPTFDKPTATVQTESACQVFEDQLGTLGRLLRASRVYFDGDSLDAHGFADLVAARKSWQSQMSQVQAKLSSCLSSGVSAS